MERYTTLKHAAAFEYEDRKSVFIGEASPVSTEFEALEFIEQVRKKYPDAKHHVYAYVLRENSVMRYTDDREPQGTAGMPVLDSIRKNGITDAVIVVTRYFGGTLLGTGGLVRAYTAAALGALKSAEIITYDIYTSVSVCTNYSDYQKLTPIMSEFSFRTDDVKYSDSVETVGSVLATHYSEFCEKIIQATSGRAAITKIADRFEY